MPLSSVVDNLVELRRRTFTAHRSPLRPSGAHLPEDFADIVVSVDAFADPLIEPAPAGTRWQAADRRWSIARS